MGLTKLVEKSLETLKAMIGDSFYAIPKPKNEDKFPIYKKCGEKKDNNE